MDNKSRKASSADYNEHSSTPVTVYKSDIGKIGGSACENFDGEDIAPGGTSIFSDVRLANIEEIFLRDILSLYGYKIVESMDHGSFDDIENFQIRFVTDMPWDEYMEIKT